MEIRPAVLSDMASLIEIDATIQSDEYLHLDRTGEGFGVTWAILQRPVRERHIDQNSMGDDRQFSLRQILGGIEEGIALAAEHDEQLLAIAFAKLNAENQTLDIVDVRVDFDYRRQGIGSAMLYQLIAFARQAGVRAITARTLTNNVPAAQFFLKAGFELGGVDTFFRTNHDLVKEAVTLFWYAALN